jgi:putative two-component system response regulator
MEGKRDTVIIVDDDLTNLTVARNNLVGTYEVFTAPSGEKLFSLLGKITPALILLDIERPGMDGYEVIKRLKADEKTTGIPVIFLTARHDPESEVMGLNLGAVDYIMKPFSKELLLKRSELHIEFEKQKQHLKDYNKNLQTEVKAQTKTIQSLQNAILTTHNKHRRRTSMS